MEAEKILTIHTNAGDYPVIIGRDNFARAKEFVKGRCMVVTDSNVAPLYLNALKNALSDTEVHSITVPAGEGSKCKERLFEIIDELARLEFNRSDTVIALGGGVAGDLTGLAAGLYMRGVRLIMMPTTLLSMVDSSCGGKVAVNHDMGKNMIGMFYQPACVIANLSTLSTLEPVQISCGAAEMVKYGCIYDKELFEILQDKNNLLAPSTIHRCVAAKDYYVTRDTLDKGLRMTLNFGHTLGHCVEKATGLLHGQAVAIGMYHETLLSERLGITERGTADKIKELLIVYDLPYNIESSSDWRKYLLHDKKSGTDGITFALIKTIGESVLETITYEKLKEEIL